MDRFTDFIAFKWGEQSIINVSLPTRIVRPVFPRCLVWQGSILGCAEFE